MTVLAGRSNPNHMDFNCLQRVKVYRLNDEGKWDDKGTGQVSVEYLERSEAVGLVIIDEEDNQTLLVHRISADDIYRRQEDTIISWTDPEVATDLALSFQETMGCSFIWDQICSVQRSIHFPSVGVGDDMEHSGTSPDGDAFHEGGGAEVLELPPVEIATLPQIVKTIAEVMPFNRDRVASLVVREQNYIRKLVELFCTCEDLENIDSLHMMFKIVKGIISLNDGHIFDIIFSDTYIMDIVGALEYDPDLSCRQDHRTYLREQVVFKEAVPIHDPAILSKIHQTYRIGYIKDVILPRVLDDQTFATINSIMLFNNVAVVSALQNNSSFLSELFFKLRSPDTPEQSRRELVFFIQEFCNLSKHLQPALRSQLFGGLVKEGLFDIVTSILKNSDESVRLSGCDILIVVLNHDPVLLRTFLVHQPQHALFSELVGGMLTHSEGGLQAQLLEIMRVLLDSDTMDAPQIDKSTFLDVFYEKYMDQMIEVLTAGCPPKSGCTEAPKESSVCLGKGALRPSTRISPEILGNICELLCFCVQHHRFRIKYYVMRNNVAEKIMRLTRRREKYLVVAAVRFLRTCIALKDEFYFRHLVKHNLFEPVIQAFLANGNRYNLLNSAVLELIDFIRKEGIKSLIVHLVENFASKLEGINYVGTFQSLKLKYDQSLEGPPMISREVGGVVSSGGPDHASLRMRDRLNHLGTIPDTRKRKDERALDKDEEDYFNEDSDDEEDTATARVSTSSSPQAMPAVTINGSVLGDVTLRGSSFGLVDYEDEDGDIPIGLGSNGKEGSGMFGRKTDVLLPTLPITDPIWSEMEDVTVSKRKAPPPAAITEGNTASPKRHKPEEGQANEQSNDWMGVRGLEDLRGAGSPMTTAKLPELSQDLSVSPSRATAQNAYDDKENKASMITEEEVFDRQSLNSASTLVLSSVPSMVMEVPGSRPDVVSNIGSPGGGLDTSGRTVSDAAPSNMSGASSGQCITGAGVGPSNYLDTASSIVPSEISEVHTGLCEAFSKGGGVDCKAAVRAATENGSGSYLANSCNGVSESSERVGVGTPSSKGNSGNSTHSVSIVSEGNKLSNLGSDLMRALTPTSPGPYTVQ